MAINNVALALVEILEDSEFAGKVRAGPAAALSKYDLSDEEIRSFNGVGGGESVASFGAWRMLSRHLSEVPPPIRQRLNSALARRASQPRAIPNTGT